MNWKSREYSRLLLTTFISSIVRRVYVKIYCNEENLSVYFNYVNTIYISIVNV